MVDLEGLVEGIALDGDEAGFADGVDEFGLGSGLGRAGAGHVEDVFLENGAVEVVGAEVEGDLGEFGTEADPVGGDVVEVVEVEAADGDGAEGVPAGGGMGDGELVMVGLVREGDEAGEAVGFILEFAEAAEVVDAVGVGFEVAVEHGAGTSATHAVPGSMDVEVFLGGFLAAGDLGTDGGGKDFGAAAGERVETGFAEFGEGIGDGFTGEPGEVEDFDGGEALQLESGVELFEGAEEVEVIGEGEGGVETADDMEFGDAEFEGLSGLFDHGFGGELEAVGVAFFAGEGAELAGEDAVVGVVEVAIDEVGGEVTDLALAGEVGEGAEGVEVGMGEELEGVGVGETLAGGHAFGEGEEFTAGEGDSAHPGASRCPRMAGLQRVCGWINAFDRIFPARLGSRSFAPGNRMFQFIRKHQAIGLIFIGIVIVSFVIFFSPNQGGDGPGRPSTYGTVNGEPISQQDYMSLRAEVRLTRMLREGGNWPTDGRGGYEEFKEVLNRAFLLQEAERLGVVVTDPVAAARILELPFLRDEKTDAFSRAAYDQFLQMIARDGGMTQAGFEEFMRHEVAIQHLVQVGGSSGYLVPPREAEARYRAANEQFSGQLVTFSPSNFVARVNMDPTNLVQFYSNRMASFRIPEKVVVRYVRFASTNFLAEADQTLGSNTNLAAAIEAEYQRQGAEAFKNAQNQTSSAEEAKAQLKEQYRKRLALESARKKANEFANKLYELDSVPDSLNKLAAENGLSVEISQPFDQFRAPMDMRVPTSFNRSAFALSAEEPFATPVLGEDAVFVFAFDHRVPSSIQPYEVVQQNVVFLYRDAESRAMAEKAGRDFATQAALALDAGKTFEAAAEEANLSVITLTNFSRTVPSLPELGGRLTVSELLRTAEEVPAGKVAPFAPGGDGGYVLFVSGRTPPPAEQVAKETPEFLAQLRQYGRYTSFNEWERRRFLAADIRGPGGVPAPGGVMASRTNAPAAAN